MSPPAAIGPASRTIDVEGQVSERADEHGDVDRKIRPWTAASDAGGSGPSSSEGSSARPAAIAAVNRRRRAQRRRGRPRGLAAFESAPCYLELLERERDESQPGS